MQKQNVFEFLNPDDLTWCEMTGTDCGCFDYLPRQVVNDVASIFMDVVFQQKHEIVYKKTPKTNPYCIFDLMCCARF